MRMSVEKAMGTVTITAIITLEVTIVPVERVTNYNQIGSLVTVSGFVCLCFGVFFSISFFIIASDLCCFSNKNRVTVSAGASVSATVNVLVRLGLGLVLPLLVIA